MYLPLCILFRYYAVPPLLVEWTSMFPMMFYVVFIFPVLYLTNKYGLRWIIIVSGGLSWLGAFMKIFSVHPDRFYFIIIGKSIAAIAQVNLFSYHSLLSLLLPCTHDFAMYVFCNNYVLSWLDCNHTIIGTRGRTMVSFPRTLDRHIIRCFRLPTGYSVQLLLSVCDSEKSRKSRWHR